MIQNYITGRCGKGHSDLLRALGAVRVCRDCRGLQPLFRNVMCVLPGGFWVGLESRLASSCSGEVNVNKSPVLTSVTSVMLQVTHTSAFDQER